MSTNLLSIDLGGTKCELALFSRPGELTPQHCKRYISKHYSSIEQIIKEYLAEYDLRPSLCSIGVAGVVHEGTAEITNLPWTIEKERLAHLFNFDDIVLINDLTAIAASLAVMDDEDLFTIQAGHKDEEQLIGIIAPGTGLGEGYLHHDKKLFLPQGTEGGHCNFAPVNKEQLELLSWLMHRQQTINYEDLLAGPGIPLLFDFYHQHKQLEVEPEVIEALSGTDDRTPVLFRYGLEKDGCPVCKKTIELFLSILGSEAGNLALKLYGIGGIYIGGGIVPRLVGKISFEGFLHSFHAKGKMTSLMKRMPIHCITRNDAALLGTAHYGFRLFKG